MLTWKKYILKGVASVAVVKASDEALAKDGDDAATPLVQMEML